METLEILAYYTCPHCFMSWTSEATIDNCPECGERHIAPIDFEEV